MTREPATDTTDTTDADRRTGSPTYRRTLGELSHTNPYTDEAFGDSVVYERGPFVAADGGRDPAREPAGDDPTLGDVDHEPPHGEGVNRVHERGEEAQEPRESGASGEGRGESA
ncbi:hypothetical protein ACFQPA_05000 [Halomarina halobia]|uniref:Uncharacterized protein n=1 Tax=Halomarina halobia TaxID=3033386 RepID=A0ABD6A6L5_9EURY|nr:hypothetical protein [Halomarina sp. PSR21]